MIFPKKYDFKCYKGQTWRQSIFFKQNDEPIDLSGITAKSQIRKEQNGHYIVADIDCTVNASEGRITLSMSAETTSKINSGAYVYDVKCTDENDEVTYYIYGNFNVIGRVTV